MKTFEITYLVPLQAFGSADRVNTYFQHESLIADHIHLDDDVVLLIDGKGRAIASFPKKLVAVYEVIQDNNDPKA